MAFTANVCGPSESDPSVFGEEHAAYVPPSVEHSNVAPAGSLDENEKVGVASLEFALGVVPIVAVGGTVSTSHANESGELE
jgi:hypothetical protein